MRRRIDIAGALVDTPKVLFLDEPTTGLDPRSRRDVWALVSSLSAQDMTVLLTTQYLEEADVLSDSIVILDAGQVIASGTADDLKRRMGFSYCEVTPVNPADLPRIFALVADIEGAEADAATNTVSVPAPNGVATLVEVLRRIESLGVDLHDISLRKPSLDEVFLHLTLVDSHRMTALVALTERAVVASVRDRDLLFAVLAPVVIFVGFTFGLQNVIDTGGMSYPQYVLPAVVVQAMLLGVLTSAERAASDQRAGFAVRLRAFPIPAAVPLMARMLYCLFRGVLSLIAAFTVAYIFGFRMTGGFGYAVAFVVIVLLLTLALSLGADATGSYGRKLDAASQLLLIPQLLLVLLSTGHGARRGVPRLAGAHRAIPACFTGDRNAARFRQRRRRRQQPG